MRPTLPASHRQAQVLVLDSDYRQIEPVIEKILETFPFSWKGTRVLIKPNVLGPYSPEKGITTHPSLICALLKALKKREAVCWVGDNPGLHGYAANEHCARTSGILDAADRSYINLARDSMPISVQSRHMKQLVISKAILDADVLINVPKFKTHVQTRITGAVKNMFGILVGAEKARVHQAVPQPRNFSEALVDIYQIRLPDLTIMDAVVGMEGNGPSGKDLRFIGKILASPNGVSVDGLMASMMGFSPRSVDYLDIAFQRGLGEIDPTRMEIRGTWSSLENFRRPLTFLGRGWFGTLVNKLIYRPLVKPHLSLRPELCTRCEVCIHHCPAQALSLKEVPSLDQRKCISCYCCYELCSNHAIELTGWISRVSGTRSRGRGVGPGTGEGQPG